MDILSDRAKREIQLKLGHYLISYRKLRRLTQDEMATQLGYSLSQYKRTELGIEPRISNAVEFLAAFAALTEKTVPEFVQYLQAIPAENRANLAENETLLLSSFSSIALDTRRDFIRHYCVDEKTKLLPLIEIANSLKSLTTAQITILQFFISIVLPATEGNTDIDKTSDLLSAVKGLLETYEKKVKSGEATFPTTI